MKTVLALALLVCSWGAHAQELRGTVRDPSGAVIAGARVVLQAPGVHAQRITDERGAFRFAGVTRGAEVAVYAAGFALAREAVRDARQPLDIVLQVLPLTQELVVTPQRAAAPLAQTDAAVARFTDEALFHSGGSTLDEKLRQVPGFTLLRRTGSHAANPTTQGASVRGLSASGASRVLVLDDGVPLNDPFGGWIYWDRVPGESIESVEVMQGGASHLYGSGALTGIVNIFPREPRDEFAADLNFGNENAPDGSAVLAHAFGPWVVSGNAEAFRTSGYVAVLPPDRGAVDTALTLRYATGRTRVERRVARDGTAFASVDLFDEGRGNGTPLQINSTRLLELRTGLDLDLGPGRLALRAYGRAQRYSQTFSAIALDRSRETLTSWQRVPAQQAGGGGQWSGAVGRHTIAVGAELRQVRGVSQEVSFTAPTPRLSSAGGRQTLLGTYAADSIRLRRLTLALGARLDRWSNRSLALTATRDGVAVSPHVGAAVPLRAGFTWTASAYRSFRAPTPNELYRNFRVGNILTLANAALQPEHLSGGETGLGFARTNVRARVNVFWDHVSDPVANTTLSSTPQLITRQRQNLGSLRSRGVELSLESRLPRHVTVNAAYQFADATVLSFPGNPLLVGLLIPQAPRHSGSFGAIYAPAGWTVSAQARAAGRQFDDDLNRLPLDPMFDLDVFVSRQIAPAAEIYLAAENVLNQRAMVGRTPTPTWGPPILLRVGARFRLWQR